MWTNRMVLPHTTLIRKRAPSLVLVRTSLQTFGEPGSSDRTLDLAQQGKSVSFVLDLVRRRRICTRP